MRNAPPIRTPTLAERALELRALALPGASVRTIQGRELRFDFALSPSAFGRLYRCELRMTPARFPEMFVMQPDLLVLADGRKLPHVYSHEGKGTKLCLWLPRKNEWQPQMSMLSTYVAWTAQWLGYYEDWLLTNDWTGGGEHPPLKKKRRA